MSRSRKKNPVVTYVNCKSQKKGKRQCNKRFRRITRQMIHRDSDLPLYMKEVMDVWDMEGDGKHRIQQDDNYYMKSLRK